MYQRFVSSLVEKKVQRWTVLPWGADGPQVFKSFVPEMLFVSGGVELLTVDGPVFVKRTVRDCAVLNITVGFRGRGYIYPRGWPWGALLAHLKEFLTF